MSSFLKQLGPTAMKRRWRQEPFMGKVIVVQMFCVMIFLIGTHHPLQKNSPFMIFSDILIGVSILGMCIMATFIAYAVFCLIFVKADKS